MYVWSFGFQRFGWVGWGGVGVGVGVGDWGVGGAVESYCLIAS